MRIVLFRTVTTTTRTNSGRNKSLALANPETRVLQTTDAASRKRSRKQRRETGHYFWLPGKESAQQPSKASPMHATRWCWFSSFCFLVFVNILRASNYCKLRGFKRERLVTQANLINFPMRLHCAGTGNLNQLRSASVAIFQYDIKKSNDKLHLKLNVNF